jgi:hypothetical protein
MKMRLIPNGVALALILLPAFDSQISTCFAQGSLTPPGAPAPTMKTLQQIEPRTPISSAPVSILNSGSYYLTDNLDVSFGDAIFISANNVTIDLNGFTIRCFDSTDGSVGIRIDTSPFVEFHDITILNGHLVGYGLIYSGGVYSGSGFGYGIYSAGAPRNVRIAGVTVSGCLNDGIRLNLNSSSVELCVVTTVGGNGIYAGTVSKCAAYQCGINGIFASTVSDSYGSSPSGYGISAQVANNCYATSTNGTGMYIQRTANNCYGESLNGALSGSGIFTAAANNCYGYAYGSGYGIYAFESANNCSGISGTSGEGLVAPLAMNCSGYSQSTRGLDALNAENCYGQSSSGTGLYAYCAISCFGYSQTSYGVDTLRLVSTSYGASNNGIGLRCINGVATGCYGYSALSVGLNAYIANGCVGDAPTPISVSYKFNMP